MLTILPLQIIIWLLYLCVDIVRCQFIFPNAATANSSYDGVNGLYDGDSVIVAYQSTFLRPTLVLDCLATTRMLILWGM